MQSVSSTADGVLPSLSHVQQAAPTHAGNGIQRQTSVSSIGSAYVEDKIATHPAELQAGLGRSAITNRALAQAALMQADHGLSALASSPVPLESDAAQRFLVALQSSDLAGLSRLVRGRARHAPWALAALPPGGSARACGAARHPQGDRKRRRDELYGARGLTRGFDSWDPASAYRGGVGVTSAPWETDVDFGMESPPKEHAKSSGFGSGIDTDIGIVTGLTTDLNDPEVARMTLVDRVSGGLNTIPSWVRAGLGSGRRVHWKCDLNSGHAAGDGRERHLDSESIFMGSMAVTSVRTARRRQMQAMRAYLGGLQPVGQSEGGGGVATADTAHASIHHATPAIELAMAPLEPSLEECREMHRTAAPGYVHPPPGTVIRVSARLQGSREHEAGGASLLGSGGLDDDIDMGMGTDGGGDGGIDAEADGTAGGDGTGGV